MGWQTHIDVWLGGVPVVWSSLPDEEEEVVTIDLILRLEEKVPHKQVCPVGGALVGRVTWAGGRGSCQPQVFPPPESNLFQQLF